MSSRSTVVAVGTAIWSTKAAMFCSMPSRITRAFGPSISGLYSGMLTTISLAISLSRPGSSGRMIMANSRGIGPIGSPRSVSCLATAIPVHP